MQNPDGEEYDADVELLKTVTTELGIPYTVFQSVIDIYRQVQQSPDLYRGYSSEAILASTLLIGCRKEGLVFSADDISSAFPFEISANTIYNASKKLQRESDLGVTLADPYAYLDDLLDELDVSERDEQIAFDILEIVISGGLASGRKAGTIVASAVYLLGRLPVTDLRVTQSRLENIADTSAVSIRNSYRKFGAAISSHPNFPHEVPSDYQE